MNISLSSYIPSVFPPARCAGNIDSIPEFFKCLARHGMPGRGLTVKRVADVGDLSLHLQRDIGLSQGQRLAEQLAPVLESSQPGQEI